jgi:hypothetical protein
LLYLCTAIWTVWIVYSVSNVSINLVSRSFHSHVHSGAECNVTSLCDSFFKKKLNIFELVLNTLRNQLTSFILVFWFDICIHLSLRFVISYGFHNQQRCLPIYRWDLAFYSQEKKHFNERIIAVIVKVWVYKVRFNWNVCTTKSHHRNRGKNRYP